MRRSITLPDEVDKRIVAEAKRRNASVSDVMVDALCYFVGMSVPQDILRARKVRIADPIKARAHAQKTSITRSRRQSAILDALADPERAKILNQIMGLI